MKQSGATLSGEIREPLQVFAYRGRCLNCIASALILVFREK